MHLSGQRKPTATNLCRCQRILLQLKGQERNVVCVLKVQQRKSAAAIADQIWCSLSFISVIMKIFNLQIHTLSGGHSLTDTPRKENDLRNSWSMIRHLTFFTWHLTFNPQRSNFWTSITLMLFKRLRVTLVKSIASMDWGKSSKKKADILRSGWP